MNNQIEASQALKGRTALLRSLRQPQIFASAALLLCYGGYLLWSIAQLQFADYDLFARLAVGRVIVATGEVPLKDLFSFSETKAIWYDHEWLAGLLFYRVLQSSGELGLFFFSYCSLLFTFLFCYAAQQQIAKQQGTSAPLLGGLLLFVAFLLSIGMWATIVRAQVLSFLLFAALAYLLSQLRSTPRVLPALLIPFLFLVWGNSHGGVIVGFGLLGLSTLSALLERRKECWLLCVVSVAAVLSLFVNPYGIGYLEFLQEAIAKDRPIIDEWDAIPLNPLKMLRSGHAGVLGFGLLFIIGSIIRWKTIPKEHLLFCAAALLYGVSHQRLLVFFYSATAMFYLPAVVSLSTFLSDTRKTALQQVAAVLSVPTALYCLWLASIAVVQVSADRLSLSRYPVAAVDWLRCTYRGGKILSSFNSGSFVLWRGYPRFLVAVDGRYEEVYEDHVVRDVQIALSSVHPRYAEKIAELDADFIIRCGRERERGPVAPYFIVYRDEHCRVEAKSAPETRNDCAAQTIWRPDF